MNIRLRPVIVALALLGLQGCSSLSGQKFVVPEMPTALEQYILAYDAYQNAAAFMGESETRTKAIEEARAACQAVIQNFPEDKEYRPLAALLLGSTETLRKRHLEAANYYQKALDEYPDDIRVQQVGLFQLGIAFDRAGRHAQAKEVYRRYIERYSADPELRNDPDAQARLAEVRSRYRMIRSE